MNTSIVAANDPDEIARCYPVMRELRAHIATLEEFMERVARQQTQGYRLAYIEADGEIRAVTGYRFIDNLFSGRVLYVDDLVTRERDRSAGFGGMLFDWLVAQAGEHNCDTMELDSGVQRFGAHRFYLNKRMDIESHHFRLKL